MSSETEPGRDCPLCPRLAEFRAEQRVNWPDWHNAPVPGFGAPRPRLLVVGLAPGLKGANRTGRPFTGDYAGDLTIEPVAGCGHWILHEKPDLVAQRLAAFAERVG